MDVVVKVSKPYPHKRQSGRLFVYVTYANRKPRHLQYAKHLLEVHLGRELSRDEIVDHIDRNVLNNDISNLRIVDKSTSSYDDAKRVKLIQCECVTCGVEFERSPRFIRRAANQGRAGPFCGKSCAGSYGAFRLHGAGKGIAQTPVASEYYYPEKKEP